MPINMSEVVGQLGLEELENIRPEELAANFMPAAVIGLADGDLFVMHEPYTGLEAELYGESHYSEGKVAQVMLRAALKNGMTPGPLYDFQGYAAAYFTIEGSPFSQEIPVNAVRIFPGAMVIDNQPVPLERRPSLVIDYGACLNGRSYLGDQMNFVAQGKRPFGYSPLTRLHFTNRVLVSTYDAHYRAGLSEMFIDNQLYIGREDGIGAATDELIQGQREHGAPTEVADIVIANGSQHTTAEDLQRGVANAHTILKQGGMLVIRSLAQPGADEIGTKRIAEWAFEAGFSESSTKQFEAHLLNVGSLMMTGHFGERAIQTLVITKS